MNTMNRSFERKIFGVLLVTILLGNVSVVVGQFTETFGDIGTMRLLKGQVRDALDSPVAGATIDIKNVTTNETYSLDADEDAFFKKADLPAGKYLVTVGASGFNLGQYTVTINRKDPSASNKYTVVRLSPGCANGNSGVALVSKLSQRSFKPD